jgi:hypothetical protein
VTGRRLLILLVVLAAIAIPAGVLQAVCAGRSCDQSSGATPRIPFCPLPDAVKQEIANGYREGRSPDVLGVTADVPVVRGDGNATGVAWPSTGTSDDGRVPLAFAGAGIRAGASIPAGVTLDRVAPTVATAIGLDRPFPNVRSGTPIDGVTDPDGARLVLLIAWKGVGSTDLEAAPNAWPFLASLVDGGAGTLDAEAGSLPLDPAAVLTTIGTGGLPSQHGITGSFVRNDQGEVVPAFGDGSPVQVIATLADDLDEQSGGRALVGLVGDDEADRGLVGGGWYPNEDPVDVIIGDGAAVPLAVDGHLSTGYGSDDVPDVLGVVMDGPIRSLDARTKRIASAARRATDGSALVVVTGTGTTEGARGTVADDELIAAVEDAVPGAGRAVAAAVPGGLFLDQDVIARAEVTGEVAVDALLGVTNPDGGEMMADAFQGFAVSFARYC